MTVGTALVILSLTEGIKNKFTALMVVYGKCTVLYYIGHWFLLRIFIIILFFATGHTAGQIVTPGNPFLFTAKDLGFNLLGVYMVWLIVITILYSPVKWFGKYKKTHTQWWLSYL